jgi:hypothetical protein
VEAQGTDNLSIPLGNQDAFRWQCQEEVDLCLHFGGRGWVPELSHQISNGASV